MSILAFVHIEKAAGTTFIHLLRKNFFPRYMDVRPVVRHGKGNLTASDLRLLSRINPFLRCIAGHSVQSSSDLEEYWPGIRFVTILRNPVDRYISQFKYWNRQLGKNVTFDQFLENEDTWNFQTKKIAGRNDLALAKSELSDRFFHVGTVEDFDEFLLMLRQKLRPIPFDVSYSLKNAGDKRTDFHQRIADRHYDEIASKNDLDLQLYDFVNETLLPQYRSEYGTGLRQDARKFAEWNTTFEDQSFKLYLDYAVRKLYCEPITGVLRKLNGLPYRGSYETN